MLYLQTRSEWKIIFIIASCIHFAGITFYGIFASGEKQPWADPPEEERGIIEEGQQDYGCNYSGNGYGGQITNGFTSSSFNSTQSMTRKMRVNSSDSLFDDGEGFSDNLETCQFPFKNGYSISPINQKSQFDQVMHGNSTETGSSYISKVPSKEHVNTMVRGPPYSVVTETVQMEPTNSYLHGGIEDRDLK